MLTCWKCWPFGKGKLQTDAQPLTAMDKMKETHKKLKKKLRTSRKEASEEVKKAKEALQAKDWEAANQSLKRKQWHEQHNGLLGKLQLRIFNQIMELAVVQEAAQTVNALKIGAAEVQKMQKELNIDDGDETVDETVKEFLASLRQTGDSLRPPSGAATDFNEDNLKARLEELGQLGQLHQPATTVPAAPATMAPAASAFVPTGPHPACAVYQRTANEDEPAALQAEMAL